MNLLAIIRILQFVIPALSALFASANVTTVTKNFGAGAGVLDSGLLQGGVLPLLIGGGSWLSGFVLNRSSGITKEALELIQAAIAFFKNQTRPNAFRVAAEVLGVLDVISDKFGIEITDELLAIEAKINAAVSPTANSRKRKRARSSMNSSMNESLA